MGIRARNKSRAKIRLQNTYSVIVERSNKNLSVQLLSPTGISEAGMTTKAHAVKKQNPNGGNIAAATLLGKLFAKVIKAKKIQKVAFDRSGYLYHGRVKALAEALREQGVIA